MPTDLPSFIAENSDDDQPPKEFDQYVHWRFHRLGNSVNHMSLHMAVQTQTLDGLAKVLDNQARLIERLSIDVAGDGNGRPGLKADLKEIKRWQAEHDEEAERRAKEHEERAEKSKWMLRWIMGIVSTLLTFCLTAFISFATSQYKQVRSLIQNQETISKQVQQLPGAGSAPSIRPNP